MRAALVLMACTDLGLFVAWQSEPRYDPRRGVPMKCCCSLLFPGLLSAALLLAAPHAVACERADFQAFRKDVEQAFSSKSFRAVADEHGDSKAIEVTLENEYDEDNPTVVLEFGSMSEFSKWFVETHRFSEQMILPEPVTCGPQDCKYELPQNTLHHGIYLRGFGSKKVGRCRALTRMHIYRG